MNLLQWRWVSKPTSHIKEFTIFFPFFYLTINKSRHASLKMPKFGKNERKYQNAYPYTIYFFEAELQNHIYSTIPLDKLDMHTLCNYNKIKNQYLYHDIKKSDCLLQTNTCLIEQITNEAFSQCPSKSFPWSTIKCYIIWYDMTWYQPKGLSVFTRLY